MVGEGHRRACRCRAAGWMVPVSAARWQAGEAGYMLYADNLSELDIGGVVVERLKQRKLTTVDGCRLPLLI